VGMFNDGKQLLPPRVHLPLRKSRRSARAYSRPEIPRHYPNTLPGACFRGGDLTGSALVNVPKSAVKTHA